MNSDNFAAVLWDMDGTLIDSEPLWIETELAMLRRYGLEMSADTHQRLIGSGLWEAAELFRDLGVPLSADEIVAEWVQGVSRGIASSEPEWRPGAVELLASLKQAGVPCALVTMSTRSLADAVIAMLPEGTFSAVVAGDEVTHAKPHPEPFLRGAAALNVPIEACLAFEDSPTGLNSAFASGAIAIGIPNMVSLDHAPAHRLISTLADFDAASLRELHLSLRSAQTQATSVTEETAQ